MIGDFRIRAEQDNDCICVILLWGPKGDRIGKLVMPPEAQATLTLLDYPDIGGRLSVESALSYAVFIGIRGSLDVRIDGDLTVWDTKWGELKPGGDRHRSYDAVFASFH